MEVKQAITERMVTDGAGAGPLCAWRGRGQGWPPRKHMAVTGMRGLEETAGEGLEGAARAKGPGWGGTSHV